MKKANYLLILVLSAMAGCKKPYTPSAVSSPSSYLVVEGAINNGPDSTIIKLSRTVNLSSKVTTNPVLNATLTVEGDQNSSYSLTETTNGNYAVAGLNLDNSHKYRLRIKTADNLVYVSDFVTVVNAPPIDSVSYVIQSNGLELYASTHDPKNNTHYYRWSYNETWIFHSNYDSHFKSNGDTVLDRDYINDEIYTCWGNDTSSTIILGSSAKLSQDIIINNPITFVVSTSEKFTSKYSILVKQYGLTADAYSFWTNLKKNTEQLGSIFDAQPSQINGNIHSVTNPSEPVIGYMSAGAVASKRIFITTQQLPSWAPTPFYQDCQTQPFLFKYAVPGGGVINQEDEYFNYNRNYGAGALFIPIEAIGPPGKLLGHTGSSVQCVDCTLRGTNKQPAFWK
jgi:hypothetical protein